MVDTIKGICIEFEENKRILSLLRIYRKGVNLFLAELRESGKTSLQGVNSFRQAIREKTNLSGANSIKCAQDALGVYRGYVRKKNKGKEVSFPVVKNMSMRAHLGYNAKLEGSRLRITVAPRKYVYLDLKLSTYHEQFFKAAETGCISLGEIVVTPTNCVFTIKKTYTPFSPEGIMAIDINERNMVSLAFYGEETVIHVWNLEKIYELNCKYFEMARKLQRRYPHDKGLHRRVLSRWYKNRKNRKDAYLHKILNEVIRYAEEQKLMIIQEDLKWLKKGVNKKVVKKNKVTGVRQRHRKLPKKILGRLNRAVFNQIQYMIDYKARWKNIPHIYVSSQNNSNRCPICGGKNKSAEWHSFKCSCGIETNRHLLACVNMMEKKRKKNEDESPRYRLDRESMDVLKKTLSVTVPVLIQRKQ